MPAMLERIHAPCGDRRRRPECPNSARRRAPPPRTGAADSREARRGWRGRATAGLFAMCGAFGSPCTCRWVGQLPDPTLIGSALFPRAMPAASSGASRALSVAATARGRMGEMRRVSQALHRHTPAYSRAARRSSPPA